MDQILDKNKGDYERRLVKTFIILDAEAKRLAAMADDKKRERDKVEAELLELLNDEGKEASARFEGIGHVTCLEPSVSVAYILDGQDYVLFDYLKKIDREDLIKTSVHHKSLAALINQHIKEGKEIPPGVYYVMKQQLRPYPTR